MRKSTALVLTTLLLPAFLIVPSGAADPGASAPPCDPATGELCAPQCVAEFVCIPDMGSPCVSLDPLSDPLLEPVFGPSGREPVGCCKQTLTSSPMTTRWTYAPGLASTGATGYNVAAVVPSGNAVYPGWVPISGASPVWKDNLAITTNPSSFGAPVEFTFEFVMCDGISRPVTLWTNADDRYVVSFNNGPLQTPLCNTSPGTCWGSIQSWTFTAMGAPFANTVRLHVHNDGIVYNGVQPAMVQWKLFY